MNELALFAGAGGGILGGHLLGWRTVCAVEQNNAAAAILAMRQNDGVLPPFPIWDDVRTFDAIPWRGVVDVVSGGFPCQDISINGKGAGLDGERSGLWAEMARIICDVRPEFVFVENSPALTVRGLGTVLADLAEMGFDAEWGCLSAEDIGAQHRRERIWIVAHSEMSRREANAQVRNETQISMPCSPCEVSRGRDWWRDKPGIHRVLNGVANRVDRIKAIGNGQVPIVAATAWNLLTKGKSWNR
jgi:DNA (cytosine-5)-methyltransferase 1